MDSKFVSALIAGCIAIVGWFTIPRIARCITKRDTAEGKVKDFWVIVSRFKDEMLNPRHLPNIWVPYFLKTVPEIREHFLTVASGMDESDRLRVATQIDVIRSFTGLSHAEIYQQEEAVKAAVEKLSNRELAGEKN